MIKLFLTLILTFSLSLAQERIIPLSPALNEIVFALGMGNQIVGNTTYATYPKKSQQIPKVGGYFNVSLEKILSLYPTLVLLQRNNLYLKDKLTNFNIKTIFIKLDTLKSIKDAILKIGSLLDNEHKAKDIVNKIDNEIDNLSNIVNKKKILIVFGKNFDLKKEIYISGNNLYFDDIIRASNNINAYQSANLKQPTVSYEGIIALNPDIVYILSHTIKDENETKKLLKPWLQLPITAAKAKTIYITTKKYAGMPSNRVILFMKDFKKILIDAKSKFEDIQTR